MAETGAHNELLAKTIPNMLPRTSSLMHDVIAYQVRDTVTAHSYRTVEGGSGFQRFFLSGKVRWICRRKEKDPYSELELTLKALVV